MESKYFEVESSKPFSESLIWQINRDFYQNNGISAWSDDIVPHHMTSNSMVGKTYAELILALLKDLSEKKKTDEVVYILELGAGHGRLAFHILMHLEKLVGSVDIKLPPYCYVLSDIVEENLNFFQEHPQYQSYFDKGLLDVSYFDAFESQEIKLRHAKTTIRPEELKQPIIAIANYFFDSIPNDLFLFENQEVSACSVALRSKEDPSNLSPAKLLKSLEFQYVNKKVSEPFYEEALLNEILEDYKKLLFNSYLFFPEKGMRCITNLKNFSDEGLVLLSMDKGFHEIHDLKKKKEPDIVRHGSFSLWVNYHALSAFCKKQGGKVFFPSFSNFHLNIGCLLFLKESETYPQTDLAYQHFVNDFGPDDFNSIKKLAYFNVSRLTFKELIALFRLSAYDSTFFIKLLPRLKQVAQAITVNERTRLAQTLHKIWLMYFSINEDYDLAYELGGMFYDLGFYPEALNHFDYSINLHGQKADIYYNKVLCYYQLREDVLLVQTLNEAKKAFPNNAMIEKLESLDMKAT